MNKHNTLIFITLAISFILSTLIKPYPFSWAVKMLPIFFLLVIVWQKINRLPAAQQATSHKLFLLGLLFSSCGDFLLDFNREAWFIFGLAAFFIAHVFYLFSLRPFNNIQNNKQKVAILSTYIGFGLLMFMLLVEGLGDLFIPVLAYMTILLLMALATIFSNKSNIWLILGGISFVISDSFIGFDKFNSAIFQNQLWVMSTYYFAQYALVKGYIKSFTSSSSSVRVQS